MSNSAHAGIATTVVAGLVVPSSRMTPADQQRGDREEAEPRAQRERQHGDVA